MQKDDNQKDDILDDVTFVDSTEDGEALPTKDIVKKLREEIKELRKEKEEYLTGWQRAKADYINLQKELESVRKDSTVFAKEIIINDILPALDSFDMAFANKESWEKVEKNWRVGVEYIYQKLLSTLSDHGVEKIDKEGIVFDPNIHESAELVKTEDENSDHKIAKIIQTGYKMSGKIIRPAKVKVYEYKKE
jgi:molecular chaperone GrpE